MLVVVAKYCPIPWFAQILGPLKLIYVYNGIREKWSPYKMIYSINMHTTVYQFWRFVYHPEQSVIDHYARSSFYTRSFCTAIKLYVGHFYGPGTSNNAFKVLNIDLTKATKKKIIARFFQVVEHLCRPTYSLTPSPPQPVRVTPAAWYAFASHFELIPNFLTLV